MKTSDVHLITITMPYHTYLKRNRKSWCLSQETLSRLLAIDQSQVSRTESGESEPDMETVIALEVIFGLSGRDLFPGLYASIEEGVMGVAARIDRELDGQSDQASLRKRELLSAMMKRATKTKGV